MKRIKRIASLALAMAMVFAMSVTVFASSNGQNGDSNQSSGGDTPKVTESGRYQIYQIFKGRYDNGTLSDIVWGANGTGSPDQKVDSSILEELQGVYEETDVENEHKVNDLTQLAVIKKYANLATTPIESGSDTTYSVDPGYYLISGTVTFTEKQGDQDVVVGTTDTLYVVRVTDGTLTFSPKVGVPTVDKKIVESEGTSNGVSIGEEVTYQITGTMPSNIADYYKYTYVFEDTLSKGLTFKEDSFNVTVNGVEVTDYFYHNATLNGEEGEAPTDIVVGIQDLKALELLSDPKVGQITTSTEVVLTYKATLNPGAVIADDGNPNEVKLHYSNNPNKDGSGTENPPGKNPEKPEYPDGVTPGKKAVVYTTELTITKTDGKTGAFLPGVEFELSGENVKTVLISKEEFVSDEAGEYWKLKDDTYTTTEPNITGNEETDTSAKYDLEAGKFKKTTTFEEEQPETGSTKVTGVVNADGTVTFRGLGWGTYTLTEKEFPGYNKLEPITFEITFDKDTKAFSSDKPNIIQLGTNNVFTADIKNDKGSLLPSTGGIGTTIFYVVGGLLVAGAGILLVTKKRMNAR